MVPESSVPFIFGVGPQTCQGIKLLSLGAVRETFPPMRSSLRRRITDSWAGASMLLVFRYLAFFPRTRCMVSLAHYECCVKNLDTYCGHAQYETTKLMHFFGRLKFLGRLRPKSSPYRGNDFVQKSGDSLARRGSVFWSVATDMV